MSDYPNQLLNKRIAAMTDGELGFLLEAGEQPQFKFSDGEREKLRLCGRTLELRREIANKRARLGDEKLSPSERNSLELEAERAERGLADGLAKRGEA